MFWDILIVAATGFTQLVVTWYGVHVSVQEHRIRNAFIIGIVGAIGIALTVYGALRTGAIQEKLQADITELKNGQQQANAGIQHIESTPPMVTVNPQINIPPTPAPKEHSKVDFVPPFESRVRPILPFAKDETPLVNVGFKNSGDFQVRPKQFHALVVVVPTDEQIGVFHKYRTQLSHTVAIVGGALNPHIDGTSYRTFKGLPLTDDDVSRLNNGTGMLCVIASMDWQDDSGHYETDFSQCLGAELPIPQGGFNWHVNPENDLEIKLH